jgi:hypothetical protein
VTGIPPCDPPVPRVGGRRGTCGSQTGQWMAKPVSVLLFLQLLSCASPAHSQLRPLAPVEWRVWDGPTLVAGAGFGIFQDQRASLAGTEGRLIEAGDISVTIRTGRVAIEVGGTLQRFFRDERVFAPPHGGVEDPGPRRNDAGDWRLATVVRLTPEAAPAAAVLRFGSRLPTTDNRVGLERDQTDFFATVGGRVRQGGLSAALEAGVGINGTREPDYEQSDVLLYILTTEYVRGRIVPVLTVTGRADGLVNRTIRGNEELGELRLGIRTAGRYWVRADVVKGYTAFSPGTGFMLAAGTSR